MVNTLLQIVNISGTTGTGLTTDVTITPNLTNVDRAFAFLMFNPLIKSDHDGDWKAWEILNTSTLRIHGDNSSNAVPFLGYIVEFDTASDIRTQTGTLGNIQSATPPYNNSTTPATSTLTAVTLAESNEWTQGHSQTGTDTSIGSEEFSRARLLTTTTWEWDQQVAPNSAQPTNLFAVADWNDSNIVVQRGQKTMGGTSLSLTISGGGTDFNTVDFTRSMIFIESFSTEENFNTRSDEIYVSAIPSGDDILITREAQGGFTIVCNFVIVEFPAAFASVQHLTHTMAATTTSNSDTITALTDFNRAFVTSTANSGAQGWGTGRPTEAVGTTGDIHIMLTTMDLTSTTNVDFVRTNGDEAIEITYQVVEFLEAAPRQLFTRINPNASGMI